MRDLPRQLSVEQLAELFEGRTRFVERLAALDDPLGRAREIAAQLSDDEKKEVLDAHPAIGAATLSARSAAEQGVDAAPELGELPRRGEAAGATPQDDERFHRRSFPQRVPKKASGRRPNELIFSFAKMSSARLANEVASRAIKTGDDMLALVNNLTH